MRARITYRAEPFALNRKFGSLTVKRIFEDRTAFCICDCGNERTVSRHQLVAKSIKSCWECARRLKGGHKKPSLVCPLPAPEPKPKPAKCKPSCTERIIDRKVFICHDPDCPRLGLFNAIIPKGPDQNVYPATA